MGIVVFGSINMDLVARCVRLPKPGETLTGRAFQTIPGGKGANQSVAIARAGSRVHHLSAIGPDNRWVLDRLACGLDVTDDDIAAMGVGGLLKEIPMRGQPRER